MDNQILFSPKPLQVGDVFVSPSLAKANYRFSYSLRSKIDGELDVCGAKETTYYDKEFMPGGWERKVEKRVDLNAFDESRGSAEFVVIATEMSGGGTGHGPGDIYPDGWGVTARRLNADGTYNPKGEKVFFRQTGCFNNILNDVTIVRKMSMAFI